MRDISRYQDTPIGSYHLSRLIGVGPVSRVYLAERPDRTEHPVALKLFEAVPLDLLEEKDQALDEVRLLACLEHPAILPVLEDGLHESMLYLVSPYLAAGSLRQRLTASAGELLPLKEVMALLRQVGEALQFAHTQQIVHANLKPENILYQDDGKVLLADFLLPSLVKSERAARLLSTFAAFYMAPEQFQGAATPLSDQYALACLAYELLTGQPPFEADDFISLVRKHRSKEPAPPSSLQPKRAQHIDHVLLKALAKRPEQRYPDIQTFLAELSAPPPLAAVSVVPETIPGPAQSAATPADPVLPVIAEAETRPFQPSFPLSIAAFELEPVEQQPTMQQALPLSIAIFEQETTQPAPQENLPVPVPSALHDVATVVVPAAPPDALGNGSVQANPAPALMQQAVLRARARSMGRLSSRQIWLTAILVALAMVVSLSGIGFFVSVSSTHHSSPLANSVTATQQPGSTGNAMPGTNPTTGATGVAASPTVGTTPTPAQPTATPTAANATPTGVAATGVNCQVHYTLASRWPGGFVANLTITNTGSSAIRGWTLMFTFAGGERITNGWNGRFTQNGAQVSIGNADFNVSLAPGSSVFPGFQAISQGGNDTPASFTLNGAACK